MKAKIQNIKTGEVISVTSSTEHPDSSYGQAVWVDENDVAYTIAGFENPFYRELEVDVSDRQDLGQYLHYLRLSQGISIRDLAERSDVAKATIVNIEGGKFSPRLDVVTKILSCLNARLTVVR